ncbi:MAG: hypothetical protein M1837_004296 [Sclerophora amabilis]|nr:MAG: hypothetical protein M1837_004296 [Sclerophora amabilis]
MSSTQSDSESNWECSGEDGSSSPTTPEGRSGKSKLRRTSRRTGRPDQQSPRALDNGRLVRALRSRVNLSIQARDTGAKNAAPKTRKSRPSNSKQHSSGEREENGTSPHSRRILKRKRSSSSLASRTSSVTSQNRVTAPKSRSRSGATRSQKEIEAFQPPWQTLPYHLLLQIFIFSSNALQKDKSYTRCRGHWLVNAARTCKPFTEPALTALYSAPPRLNSHRALGLLKLLQHGYEGTIMKYGPRIRRLEAEVLETLCYASPGEGLLDLAALIEHTPQLEELDLFHVDDSPPYRTIEKKRKWLYPDNLFAALDDTQIRLRMWRWNTRMTGPEQLPPLLAEIHQRPSFQSIEHLVLVEYHPSARPRKDEGGSTNEEDVAGAISILPRLSRLTLKSCSIVNETFLHLLPRHLSAITFTNCPDLTGGILHSFLASHGQHIKKLIVDHNRSLSLSFLPGLAASCPTLEVFKADLQLYSTRFLTNNSNPNFETLLSAQEVPRWPGSLRDLEILQLRHWTAEAAIMFFSSLIDSASELPNLRSLVLKAILKIAWRDRANFRDLWINRLEHVFLRKCESPRKELMSLRKWDAHQAAIRRRQTEAGSHSTFAADKELRPQRSHPGIQPFEIVIHQKSYGLRERKPINGPEVLIPRDRLSREETETSSLETDSQGDKTPFRQGMCHVVDIRIDNMRPMENQFKEDDFLDDEASGDEDWDGDDNVPAHETYAW